MQGKYTPPTLLPPLRLFINARNKAIEAGFTDNGGAIHSVERILDILCQRVKYPHLRHINSLKKHPKAECSVDAHHARLRGESVLIEHVMPRRAFAQEVIRLVISGCTDDEIISFIQQNYRLVLLSPQETMVLNRLNRSRITPDRLTDAGIVIFQESASIVHRVAEYLATTVKNSEE
ncbi:hypothetical protein GIW41_28110 [Pseudomonas sp. PA-6-1D]|uniref:hypothetical protein n=1 Tax=unclassified Pseudomonas TaxID=196821 RepID=UPI001F180EAD|nr:MULTISPECIES: hypothetical protein [unclassified Pseudomonas]MCF5142822.1 hypothetical protein [Pseudomonas sp. PA-6-3C]MCF5150844.1 hypothetical protein [Pseudomonas sp. PA-6-3F]MCF5161380.1 hypothetical protein [Pseudomonas sp. PA-6-2E]MCF5179118.1 hypothetical protein [Pseudomonas sp. PA-6-1D]MCF5195907.1 hypothetical protein [Pseudomonas sp. PA-6-1H]